MLSFRRSFAAYPDAFAAGHPYSLDNSRKSSQVPFIEFRGTGPPSSSLGDPGDVYVDLTPGSYAFYWRDRHGHNPGHWRRWTALLLDRVPLYKYLVAHPWVHDPQTSDLYLWIDPTGVTWTSRAEICASRALMVQKNIATIAPGERNPDVEALVAEILVKMIDAEERRTLPPILEKRDSYAGSSPPYRGASTSISGSRTRSYSSATQHDSSSPEALRSRDSPSPRPSSKRRNTAPSPPRPIRTTMASPPPSHFSPRMHPRDSPEPASMHLAHSPTAGYPPPSPFARSRPLPTKPQPIPESPPRRNSRSSYSSDPVSDYGRRSQPRYPGHGAELESSAPGPSSTTDYPVYSSSRRRNRDRDRDRNESPGYTPPPPAPPEQPHAVANEHEMREGFAWTEMQRAQYAEAHFKRELRQKNRELSKFKKKEKDIISLSFMYQKKEQELLTALASAEQRSKDDLEKQREALRAAERQVEDAEQQTRDAVRELRRVEEALVDARNEIQRLKSYAEKIEVENEGLKGEMSRFSGSASPRRDRDCSRTQSPGAGGGADRA